MATLDLSILSDADDKGIDVPYEILTDALMLAPLYQPLLRFDGVTVPVGATITAAYVTVYALGTLSDSAAVLWQMVKAADPAMPATYAAAIALTLTTASTAQELAAWTADEAYDSPSLVAVLQEVVDQAEWASGNAVIVVIVNTGVGSRTAFDYNNGVPAKVASLHIEYTVPTTRRAKRTSSIGRRYLRF